MARTKAKATTASRPSASQASGSSAQAQGGNPSGSPAPQVSGSSAQTQGVSSPPTGSSIAVKPFVPAKFDLPMLDDDGDNYDLWSKALTLALRNRGLWPIVNSSETPLDQTADPAAHDKWCLKNQEVQLMILLASKKVGQKCIYRTQTSKDSWDRLKTRYSTGGDWRTVLLLEQFL